MGKGTVPARCLLLLKPGHAVNGMRHRECLGFMDSIASLQQVKTSDKA